MIPKGLTRVSPLEISRTRPLGRLTRSPAAHARTPLCPSPPFSLLAQYLETYLPAYGFEQRVYFEDDPTLAARITSEGVVTLARCGRAAGALPIAVGSHVAPPQAHLPGEEGYSPLSLPCPVHTFSEVPVILSTRITPGAPASLHAALWLRDD